MVIFKKGKLFILIFETPAHWAKTVILNKLGDNLDKKSDTMVEFQQFFFLKNYVFFFLGKKMTISQKHVSKIILKTCSQIQGEDICEHRNFKFFPIGMIWGQYACPQAPSRVQRDAAR
jgi:hypothetical protein